MRIILLLIGFGMLLSCNEEIFEELIGYDDDENQEFMLFLDDLAAQYGKRNPAFQYSFVEISYGVDALIDYKEKLEQNDYNSLSPQSKLEYKQIEQGIIKISNNSDYWKVHQLMFQNWSEISEYWVTQPVNHQLLEHVLKQEVEAFQNILTAGEGFLCEEWKKSFLEQITISQNKLNKKDTNQLVTLNYLNELKNTVNELTVSPDCKVDAVFYDFDVIQTRQRDCDSIEAIENSKPIKSKDLILYLDRIACKMDAKAMDLDSILTIDVAFQLINQLNLEDSLLKYRMENYQQHPMFKGDNIFTNDLFMTTLKYYMILECKDPKMDFKLCELSNPLHRQAVLDARKWKEVISKCKKDLGSLYSDKWMFQVLSTKGNLNPELMSLAIDFECRIKKHERNPNMQEH